MIYRHRKRFGLTREEALAESYDSVMYAEWVEEFTEKRKKRDKKRDDILKDELG